MTIPLQSDLERLLNHEAAYYAFASRHLTLPIGSLLSCPALPQSREANRFLRIRDDGSGPDAVAAMAIACFQEPGMRVCVEVDAEAERQGLGRALRLRGITPVMGSRSLMAIHAAPVSPLRTGVAAHRLEKDADSIQRWLRVNLHDVEEYENPQMWRSLAALEAESDRIGLYLATVDGEDASTCSLFCADGLARIEMVETVEPLRRRGAAMAAVSAAVQDAFDAGCMAAYLYTDTGSGAEQMYLRLGFERLAVDVTRRHLGIGKRE